MRETLLRGFWIGVIYSTSYFLLELSGASIVLKMTGATTVLLQTHARELASLFVQYSFFGGLMGLVLSLPIRRFESRLPGFWTGPRLNFLVMAVVFTAIAYLWISDHVLGGHVYSLVAAGTLVLLFLAKLFYNLLVRLGLWRLLATRKLLQNSAYALVAIVFVLGGIAIYGTLSRSPWKPDRRSRPAPSGQVHADLRHPNIMLIVLDALRQDHVSSYGYGRRTTPNFDRLAAEGVLYERAFSASSASIASHASLFTGLYPSAHQTNPDQLPLGSEKTTIAEVLKSAGYRTGCFSANPWVGPVTGLDQGFERYEYLGIQFVTGTFLLNLVKGQREVDLGGAKVTEHLLRWAKEAHRDGAPFFAFANYMEVHEPYGTFPEPYFSTYLEEELPKGIGREWLGETGLFFCGSCPPGRSGQPEEEKLEETGADCNGGRWRFGEKRLNQTKALYDAGALYVDHQIGRIYRFLEKAGILDNTVFIVTSDHGEFLGAHGKMGHGIFLYQSVLKVPLVIRYPGLFPRGMRIEQSVSLVDVFPTVEALSGGSPRHDFPMSLIPSEELFEREDKVLAERYPIAEAAVRTMGRLYRCDYSPVGHRRASLQKKNVKYIWSSSGKNELFNLGNDPDEEHNLITELPDLADAMDTELHEWLEALQAKHGIETWSRMKTEY